jgi:hypothetical protein
MSLIPLHLVPPEQLAKLLLKRPAPMMPLLTFDVPLHPFPELRGEKRLAIFRAEDQMDDKACERLRHADILSARDPQVDSIDTSTRCEIPSSFIAPSLSGWSGESGMGYPGRCPGLKDLRPLACLKTPLSLCARRRRFHFALVESV